MMTSNVNKTKTYLCALNCEETKWEIIALSVLKIQPTSILLMIGKSECIYLKFTDVINMKINFKSHRNHHDSKFLL